jgi:anti-sigma B factor antagonist
MSLLEIRQERDTPTGVEVVAPQGEIDISNVAILDQILGEVVQQQPHRLLIDLSGVGYIDSAGISSLMRAGQKTVQRGRQFCLVGGRPFVRRLLRMTGMDRLYPHFETVGEAIGEPGEAPAGSPSPADASTGTPFQQALAPR